jgi:hypothetical protein
MSWGKVTTPDTAAPGFRLYEKLIVEIGGGSNRLFPH